jgi:hypothetical protein
MCTHLNGDGSICLLVILFGPLIRMYYLATVLTCGNDWIIEVDISKAIARHPRITPIKRQLISSISAAEHTDRYQRIAQQENAPLCAEKND